MQNKMVCNSFKVQCLGFQLTDIENIKEIEENYQLLEINLHWNKITEMKGLEHLGNLRVLLLHLFF